MKLKLFRRFFQITQEVLEFHKIIIIEAVQLICKQEEKNCWGQLTNSFVSGFLFLVISNKTKKLLKKESFRDKFINVNYIYKYYFTNLQIYNNYKSCY